jgi:hypothetical protein
VWGLEDKGLERAQVVCGGQGICHMGLRCDDGGDQHRHDVASGVDGGWAGLAGELRLLAVQGEGGGVVGPWRERGVLQLGQAVWGSMIVG